LHKRSRFRSDPFVADEVSKPERTLGYLRCHGFIFRLILALRGSIRYKGEPNCGRPVRVIRA
jgi:hypothetical protein